MSVDSLLRPSFWFITDATGGVSTISIIIDQRKTK